jgi:hypothetical protein
MKNVYNQHPLQPKTIREETIYGQMIAMVRNTKWQKK